jgi:hypothetical protein
LKANAKSATPLPSMSIVPPFEMGTFTTVDEITGVADALDAADQAATAERLPSAAVCTRDGELSERRPACSGSEGVMIMLEILCGSAHAPVKMHIPCQTPKTHESRRNGPGV